MGPLEEDRGLYREADGKDVEWEGHRHRKCHASEARGDHPIKLTEEGLQVDKHIAGRLLAEREKAGDAHHEVHDEAQNHGADAHNLHPPEGLPLQLHVHGGDVGLAAEGEDGQGQHLEASCDASLGLPPVEVMAFVRQRCANKAPGEDIEHDHNQIEDATDAGQRGKAKIIDAVQQRERQQDEDGHQGEHDIGAEEGCQANSLVHRAHERLHDLLGNLAHRDHVGHRSTEAEQDDVCLHKQCEPRAERSVSDLLVAILARHLDKLDDDFDADYGKDGEHHHEERTEHNAGIVDGPRQCQCTSPQCSSRNVDHRAAQGTRPEHATLGTARGALGVLGVQLQRRRLRPHTCRTPALRLRARHATQLTARSRRMRVPPQDRHQIRHVAGRGQAMLAQVVDVAFSNGIQAGSVNLPRGQTPHGHLLPQSLRGVRRLPRHSIAIRAHGRQRHARGIRNAASQALAQ
mmetsp:Transcript_48108/g.123856  ORF Transcript_48108/g.123856 Transcript_48108/m.123856 type:complete len:461 (-) Transcript_48108:35-1417(-)